MKAKPGKGQTESFTKLLVSKLTAILNKKRFKFGNKAQLKKTLRLVNGINGL